MLTVYDAIDLVGKFTSTVAKSVRLEEFSDPQAAQYILPAAHQLIVRHDGLQKKVAPIRFEFRPGEAHLEYGKDLIRNGLFVLPYMYTMVSWPDPTLGEDGHTIISRGRSYCLVIDIREHLSDYLLLAGFKSPDDQQFSLDTLAFLDLSQAADTSRGLINFIPLDMHAAYWNLAGRPKNFVTKEVLHLDTATTVGGVVGCMAALASKGVETSKPTEKEVKTALRHPLRKRQQRPDVRVTLNIPESPSDRAGGTHASPVPHWRRGHIRRIARNGETTTIQIPPCLVNAHDEVRVAMKQYVVKDGNA